MSSIAVLGSESSQTTEEGSPAFTRRLAPVHLLLFDRLREALHRFLKAFQFERLGIDLLCGMSSVAERLWVRFDWRSLFQAFTSGILQLSKRCLQQPHRQLPPSGILGYEIDHH